MHNSANTNAGVWKGVGYTIGVLVAAVLLWVWYVNNNYTFVFDNNFMDSCMAQGASGAVCECALDAFKDNYGYKEAKQIEESGVYPPNLLDVISARCS
jgi:hypothetical protein